MKRQQGFTLVEIAIVLVIIGLILGGILKGQELIDSARVRSISTDLNGMRTAWFAFQDRYNALPGDFSNAATQIDSSLTNGGGNGQIDSTGESAGVWEHLAQAGFISGSYDGNGGSITDLADTTCGANTCPQNPFNGFYKVAFTNQGEDNTGNANELNTGDQVPVNIMLQLDLKLDDGVANSGELRAHSGSTANCMTAGGDWDIGTGSSSCGAVLRGF